MSPQDNQYMDWQVFSICILQFLVLLSTPVYIQNINKQNVNIADETLTDYSFLGRYHYTKFQKEYWRRLNKENIWYWIVKFCPFVLYVYGFGRTFLNMVSLTTWTLIWTSSISCRLWRRHWRNTWVHLMLLSRK